MTTSPSSDASSQIVSRSPAVVFANTQSGRGKFRKLLPHIEIAFRSHGLLANIRETSSSKELEFQAAQAIQQGTRLLFAVGGDGTLQGLVNAAYGHDVLLGVIPAGGGNDFARALNLPLEPLAALAAALSGLPLAVDLVRVRTCDGHMRLYLGGGGAGLDAESAELAGTRYKNWPGRLRYVASAVRAYFSYRPQRVRVTLDTSEETPWKSFILASVLNTPTFGAGIKLAPSARINDGLLDFSFLEELRFSQLVAALPRLVLKGTLHLPHMSSMRVRKLRLETEVPAFFQADGELIGLTPVEIEVVPEAVRFLVPKVAES
jgi:diacylglycerol kinase (ATP)